MKKDVWCAFKSIGAVKIKQPKERALDRLFFLLPTRTCWLSYSRKVYQ
jgi:hypothetical protein